MKIIVLAVQQEFHICKIARSGLTPAGAWSSTL